MKMLSSELAIFIFSFKDNIIFLELYTVKYPDQDYIFKLNSVNEKIDYLLEIGEIVKITIKEPRTEREVLHMLAKSGFKEV